MDNLGAYVSIDRDEIQSRLDQTKLDLHEIDLSQSPYSSSSIPALEKYVEDTHPSVQHEAALFLAKSVIDFKANLRRSRIRDELAEDCLGTAIACLGKEYGLKARALEHFLDAVSLINSNPEYPNHQYTNALKDFLADKFYREQ